VTAPAASFVVQSAALISISVTVVLFAVTQILSIRQRKTEARSASVTRVLDALDRVARRHTWPVVAKKWLKPEVDYALLVPRLFVGLPKRDRVIGVWLATQVNLMAAAPTQTAVFKIAADASSQIANWHIRQVPRTWFQDEVDRHEAKTPRPLLRAFVLEMQGILTLIFVAGVAAVVAGIGAALGSSRVTNGRW
jgi:hypothetical protein